jgi:hypothetical protein
MSNEFRGMMNNDFCQTCARVVCICGFAVTAVVFSAQMYSGDLGKPPPRPAATTIASAMGATGARPFINVSDQTIPGNVYTAVWHETTQTEQQPVGPTGPKLNHPFPPNLTGSTGPNGTHSDQEFVPSPNGAVLRG